MTNTLLLLGLLTGFLGILLSKAFRCSYNQGFSNSKSVLLIIAHPDDEAMFFGPTLSRLVKAGVNIRVICFSNGNAHGLGKVREKELAGSLARLGIARHVIINDL